MLFYLELVSKNSVIEDFSTYTRTKLTQYGAWKWCAWEKSGRKQSLPLILDYISSVYR